MSAFIDPLVVLLADPKAHDHSGQWQLIKPLRYESEIAGRVITVPFGFSTDFASVPRSSVIAWGLFGGRGMRPAVVNDYITRQRLYPRPKCDRIFLEALEIEGLPMTKALPMYLGVVAYTKSGLWKSEVDQPGYEPII